VSPRKRTNMAAATAPAGVSAYTQQAPAPAPAQTAGRLDFGGRTRMVLLLPADVAELVAAEMQATGHKQSRVVADALRAHYASHPPSA